MERIRRVTKKESSPARQYAEKLIKMLHQGMAENYKFEARLVGSAKWNTILKEKGKYWDLDYQILLSNSCDAYKENGFNNPTQIKNDFFNYFNRLFNGKNGFIVQNSTTAITIINKNAGYSFDFVIIRNKRQIIRRNNNDNSGKNSFTWNKLKKYNPAYDKFATLSAEEKIDLIENHILPRKKRERLKRENDSTKKSSCELFIEEVNNYVFRK